mgnify:FL=1
MPKVNIHIEVDTADASQVELLERIAQAFKVGGKQAPAPAVEKDTPKVDEPKKPKSGKKQIAEEPKAEESIGEETTIEELEKAPATTYTIDEVRTAFADAKRSGKPNDKLKAILKKHNANIVSELQPEDYAAVIKAIEKL